MRGRNLNVPGQVTYASASIQPYRPATVLLRVGRLDHERNNGQPLPRLRGSGATRKRAWARAARLMLGAHPAGRVQSVTLIITCKGPEGLALAADSRATITVTTDSGEQGITYVDSATKLFALAGQPYVGLLAWGQYFFGDGRSIAGAIPELEIRVASGAVAGG